MGQAQGKSGFQLRKPTLERGRPRGTKAPGPGERPRKGRRARINGVSGPATGGGRTVKARSKADDFLLRHQNSVVEYSPQALRHDGNLII